MTTTRELKKYNSYNERQLKKLLDNTEKERSKFESELKRIENKIKNIDKRKFFIQDALIQKWRNPSQELQNAINEVKNGETVEFSSIQEAKAYMENQ